MLITFFGFDLFLVLLLDTIVSRPQSQKDPSIGRAGGRWQGKSAGI